MFASIILIIVIFLIELNVSLSINDLQKNPFQVVALFKDKDVHRNAVMQAYQPPELDKQVNPVKASKPWLSTGVKNAISSALATILVKTLLQPLDTVTTLQQSHLSKRGLVATARELVLQRGPLSLWSGTLVAALGSTPAAAVYYGVFSSVKTRLAVILPNRLRWLAVATAATFSNSIASVFRVPYEVYKQRMQIGMHRTVWEAMQYSLKVEGPLGLFRKGKLSSQIIRDVPYAIITAVVYDLLQLLVCKLRNLEASKQSQGKASPRFYQIQDAFCGAAAGGVSSFLTTPMDVVKTKLMTSQRYDSFIDATGRILKEEGLSSFFVGSSSRVLHKIPANALFFVFYEAFRFMTGAVERRSEQ